jgi:hypothetical protein
MTDNTSTGRDLPELRDYIRQKKAALAGFLELGADLELSGDTLRVIPRSDIYVRYLTDNKGMIAVLATEFYGRPIAAEIAPPQAPETLEQFQARLKPATVGNGASTDLSEDPEFAPDEVPPPQGPTKDWPEFEEATAYGNEPPGDDNRAAADAVSAHADPGPEPPEVEEGNSWNDDWNPADPEQRNDEGPKHEATLFNGKGKKPSPKEAEPERQRHEKSKQTTEELRRIIQSNPVSAYQEVLGEELTKKPGQKELVAHCPLHNDRNPSFRVNREKATWFCDPCGVGGDLFDLAEKVWNVGFPAARDRLADLLGLLRNGTGTSPKPSGAKTKPAATNDRKLVKTTPFEIRDLDGGLRAIHLRHEYSDGSKSMPWAPTGVHPAGLPLYGINRMVDSQDGEPIIVVEGEKCVDSLWERGFLAVGTVTGAAHVPCDDSLRPLLPFRIYLWPDNDDAGRKHMGEIGWRLLAMGAADVRLIQWQDAPEHGDAADFTGDVDALLDRAEMFERSRNFNGNGALVPNCNGGPPRVNGREIKPLPAPMKAGEWFSQEKERFANAEYVWDGILEAGAIAMIGGKKGHGKSTFARTLALKISRGEEFMGRQTVRSKVWYMDFEPGGKGRIKTLESLGWCDDDWLEFSTIPPPAGHPNVF